MPRRAGLVVGVVLCLVALSACTARDEASNLDRYSTSSTPAPADVVAQVEVSGITITWQREPRDRLITSVGSSSCPRVTRRARGDASQTLVVAGDAGLVPHEVPIHDVALPRVPVRGVAAIASRRRRRTRCRTRIVDATAHASVAASADSSTSHRARLPGPSNRIRISDAPTTCRSSPRGGSADRLRRSSRAARSP
jgi:hypothetical protein